MTLSIYQYQAPNYTTNTPLPGANVSVYVGSSNTLDTIYSVVDGTAINNPMVADSNGFCNFQASSIDTLIVSAGSYVSPRLLLANVGVSGSSLSNLTTLVTNLESIVYAVQALVNGINTQITALNTDLENDISSVNNQITANQIAANAAISGINSDITTLQTSSSTASNQLAGILNDTIPLIQSTATANAQAASAAVATEAGARSTADSAIAGQLNSLSSSFGTTNLLLWSSDLTNSAWTLQGSTIVAYGTAPDGSGAFQLDEDSSTGSHQFYQVTTQSFINGQLVTGSVYAKDTSGVTGARLYAFDGQTYRYAEFNLYTGALEDQNGYAATITPSTNGWYRISFTVQMVAQTASGFYLSTQRNGTTSYTGSPAYGLGVWGPQFTPTPGPCPYVATQGSAYNSNAVANVNAALTTESATRASADSGLSAQIFSLSSTVSQNYSTVTSELATLTDSNGSTAASVTTLKSTVDSNYATLNSENVTNANNIAGIQNNYSSLSAEVNSLSTTVGGTPQSFRPFLLASQVSKCYTASKVLSITRQGGSFSQGLRKIMGARFTT